MTKKMKRRKREKPERKNPKNISVRNAKSKKTGKTDYPGSLQRKHHPQGGNGQDTPAKGMWKHRAAFANSQRVDHVDRVDLVDCGDRGDGERIRVEPRPSGGAGGVQRWALGGEVGRLDPSDNKNSAGQLGGHCQGFLLQKPAARVPVLPGELRICFWCPGRSPGLACDVAMTPDSRTPCDWRSPSFSIVTRSGPVHGFPEPGSLTCSAPSRFNDATHRLPG